MNAKCFIFSSFIRQNQWHSSSVFGHTIKVVYQVLKNRDYRFLIPALLHDIGKPVVAFQNEYDKEHGYYSFHDHEEMSYNMIKYLPFSNWTKNIVRWHYLIRDIKKSIEKGDIQRYKAKRNIWNSLDFSMQRDLAKFLIYDDMGKKTWSEQ